MADRGEIGAGPVALRAGWPALVGLRVLPMQDPGPLGRVPDADIGEMLGFGLDLAHADHPEYLPPLFR
jgi:hypothetical protein